MTKNNNTNNNTNNNKGMTLIEIVIGMGIFAFITIFTSSTVQNIMQYKRNTDNRLEAEGIVRSALRIMVKDFERAYNYKDINIQLYNLAQKQRIEEAKEKARTNPSPPANGGSSGSTAGSTNPNPATPSAPGAQAVDYEKNFPLKEEIILTHFKGETDTVSFTSLNNIETNNNVPESDQAEISYNLQECKSPYGDKGTSNCLIRTSSNYIDDELEEGGIKTIFLENIEKFQLRYLGTEHDIESKKLEWVKKWDSEEGDEEIRNKFPGAVEITLEVAPFEKNKKYKIAMTMIASVWGSNVTTEFNTEDSTPPAQPDSAAGANGGTNGGTVGP